MRLFVVCSDVAAYDSPDGSVVSYIRCYSVVAVVDELCEPYMGAVWRMVLSDKGTYWVHSSVGRFFYMRECT